MNFGVYKFQENFFNIITIITYLLYFLIIFGLSAKAPEYLTNLNSYLTIYISIFLLYRFNPFRRVEFTNLDKNIVFTAGFFLFTTTIINALLITYLENIKSYFLTNFNIHV
jgi:hypothetical protein